MMTKRARRELLDKLHRGFVWSMIGITVVGFGCICMNVYQIIQGAKAKEKIMLAELELKDDPEEFPRGKSQVPHTVGR